VVNAVEDVFRPRPQEIAFELMPRQQDLFDRAAQLLQLVDPGAYLSKPDAWLAALGVGTNFGKADFAIEPAFTPSMELVERSHALIRFDVCR
jgi:hypothetical protein